MRMTITNANRVRGCLKWNGLFTLFGMAFLTTILSEPAVLASEPPVPPGDDCKGLLVQAGAAVKKSVLKGILSERRLPDMAGMTPEVQLSLLDPQDIKKIEEVLYSDYRDWVKAHKRYPPTLEEFKASLGISELDAGEQARFHALFDSKYGIFKGFEEDFIANANSRNPEYAKFFSKFLNTKEFGPEVQERLRLSLRESPSFLLGGYISEQPLANGIEKALENLRRNLYPNQSLPVVITPAYGIASGLPQGLNRPADQHFVCPYQVHLSDHSGNAFSINEVALPPRALQPETGMVRKLGPGKTMVLVHGHSLAIPKPSDTKNPSMIFTTGAITEAGHYLANSAIGSRISSIQNAEHATQVLLVEKSTGLAEETRMGLESQPHIRAVPYLDRTTSFRFGDEEWVLPPGFADLNKFYADDGSIIDLPLFITLGDSHSPNYDPRYYEALYRQFINPETALKRTDGKPVDILGFASNDSFNFDAASRWTEGDQAAKESLAKDPLESNIDLHLKKGMELVKDMLRAVKDTRGYTPHWFLNYSNHCYDRLARKFSTGGYAEDPVNVAAYNKMKSYQTAGKNFLSEYLIHDIGVSYPRHVHVLGPKDKLYFTNALIAHGHTGGVYGKPLSQVKRKAAAGNAVLGDSHLAGWQQGVYNSGQSMIDPAYAESFYKAGFQALTIQSPVHTQVLFFKDGKFFGAQTHGNPNLEFRPGFPLLKPLEVDAQTLPGTSSSVDQYKKNPPKGD